jgi:hypothetical protein
MLDLRRLQFLTPLDGAEEGASVWPCTCVFPRSLCAGVGAALPTHDALDHHGRDAREHGLGFKAIFW